MNMNAYDAAQTGALWRAMSHFGRFVCRGKDAAALLHHLTTNDIKRLKSGEGCDAALVTNKARVLDWLTLWRRDDDFLVMTSPNRRELFAPHARRFVLFRQDIQIEDVTETSALWGLFGPQVKDVLESWGAAGVLDAPFNRQHEVEIGGATLRLARTARLPGAGVLVASDDRAALQRAVEASGLPLADDGTYNVLRVEAGLPVAGLELTEEFNPWEAGLDAAISLHKGCYNGQEVVARLNTYGKVKQRLCGLKLQTPLPLGARAALQSEGKNAGVLTSSALSPRLGAIGLGYVRNAFLSPGTALQIEHEGRAQTATVAELPFTE
jgi:aminomethyltransferase